ncbi:uncharacterized protein PHALS_12347 [Plasmopara halstedii]|uniref:Uncharacterized protein n=1 Tax=Plasmopara halstedii TaxID=4781 RepID=A0A0P1AM91_PLAHL|nr:uncharacterized protein PHALS_12347 [Plasmopara halstedii]CEG42041.1 hypothetical protein PHALS_12347 [Plasmopara halstedii]|eukprot:XP_024578410.1 hypothetical protein PHALS_12347 [Plasmopara halstedii]
MCGLQPVNAEPGEGIDNATFDGKCWRFGPGVDPNGLMGAERSVLRQQCTEKAGHR